MSSAEYDEAEQLVGRADALFDIERYEDALPLYAKAASVDPSDTHALCRVASCLQNLSRYEESLAVAEEAVAEFPELPHAYWELAYALVGVNRYGEALEAIRQTVRLEPNRAIWHRGLAHIATKAGELGVARAAVDRACVLEPDNPFSWARRGQVAKVAGDYQETIRCYEQALSFDPEEGSYVAEIAHALENTGQWDAAAERYRDALRLDPKNGWASRRLLETMTAHLVASGRRDQAVAAVEEYLAFNRGLASPVGAAAREIDFALVHVRSNLAALGYCAQALTVADDLVDRVREQLARGEGEQARLADRLVARGELLAKLTRFQEALTATGEAMSLYHPLAEAEPEAHTQYLATIQKEHSRHLARMERHDEAVRYATEAVTLCRNAARRWPRMRDDVAWALCNQTDRLMEAGQSEHALEAIQEAADIWRTLHTETESGSHLNALAGELSHVAEILAQCGRQSEAIPYAEEADELYRICVAAQPQERVWLDESLTIHGQCLTGAGRHTEALTVLDEAITSLRELIPRTLLRGGVGLGDTDVAREALAKALDARAAALTALGRPAEAAEATAEATVTREEIAAHVAG